MRHLLAAVVVTTGLVLSAPSGWITLRGAAETAKTAACQSDWTSVGDVCRSS